ncbi:MAG: hypothetical protein KGY65_00035 [Candidatus Thermoplasmatota archaeon]|nr:hypothetical protein [Candidatus Thermoplasmatota archaeon]
MKKIITKIKSNLLHKWWFHQQQDTLFEHIINIPVICSKYLPFPLKKSFVKIIDDAGLALFRFIHVLFSIFQPYYIFVGNEKITSKSIKILFKGNPKNLRFITKRLYHDIVQIKRVNKKQVKEWKSKKGKKTTHHPDVSITESDIFYRSFFQKKGCIIIPEYVTFLLNATKSMDEIMDSISFDMAQDIQKAKKTNYTFEVRNDVNAFNLFYYQMYLPYLTWKHKNSNRTASHATMQHLQIQGAEILFIKHADEYIFGGIFHKEKNIIKTYYAGLMNNKFSHLHNGIMALSYYYLITIAKKRKCQSIDFGTAEPFTDDGLYNYKNKWKMDIIQSPPYSSDIFAVQIFNKQNTFNQFIENHPVHYFDGARLRILEKIV